MILFTGPRRDFVETVNKLEVVLGEIDVMSTGRRDRINFIFFRRGKKVTNQPHCVSTQRQEQCGTSDGQKARYTSLPEAQWLEHPTGVREVMGSIPAGDSDFIFVARDKLNITMILLIHSPSLKFTIFRYLSALGRFGYFLSQPVSSIRKLIS